MGTLTGNLHTLFTSFYQPTPQRYKIMYEGKAFPSDSVRVRLLCVPPHPPKSVLTRAFQYAFASHVALHDYPPSSLLPVYPREGEHAIRTEDILRIIEEQGDSIAVICFGAVQYYSGQWFDMEAITEAGRAKVRGMCSGRDLRLLYSPLRLARAASSALIARTPSATYRSSCTTGTSTLRAGVRTST